MTLSFSAIEFLTGAASMRGLPPDTGVEVAFAGRSNAGKSSALNAVAGRRSLARTSKTPGRTQQINFFSISDTQRLVDLPGYGFAKAPPRAQRRWANLVEGYLRERRSLAGLVLLMDVRRPLTDLDARLVDWCLACGVALHAVLTKVDKLGRGAATKALGDVRGQLAIDRAEVSCQVFSAPRGDGLDELRTRLESWLALPPTGPEKKRPSVAPGA